MGNAIKPVGTRLYSILKNEKENNVFKYSVCEKIVSHIDEIIVLIQDCRRRLNVTDELANDCLVDYLFASLKAVDDKKRVQVITQCSVEFLLWCRKCVQEDKIIPRTILENFYYDTAYLGYLGDAFCEGFAGRSSTWSPIDTFGQTFRWFCYDKPIERKRLLSDFLCVFELRQSMEVKFKRLLGFRSISEAGVKIAHNIIPDILEQNISTKNFDPGDRIDITHVMKVYKWTNESIHNMKTYDVWTIWKAMMVVGAFFKCTPRSNGMMSIHDSFEFSEALLEKMRNEFAKEIAKYNKKRLGKRNKQNFAIEWDTPEAAIVDENGRWLKVKPRTQNVLVV